MKQIVLVLTSLAAVTAMARTPHPVGKWCKADQEKLCAGMEWGTGLGKCLHEKKDSVSDVCKQHHPKLFGATPPSAPTNGTGQ